MDTNLFMVTTYLASLVPFTALTQRRPDLAFLNEGSYPLAFVAAALLPIYQGRAVSQKMLFYLGEQRLSS